MPDNNVNPLSGTADVVANLKSWANVPFSAGMNITGWALFTGLIIVLSILWIMILHDLRGEI